ncbi:MAG: hypothetical protein EXS12_04010 [Phycisphaerales bacterium]|nr:hypothetical protein [Phycisphaerales bacterium]
MTTPEPMRRDELLEMASLDALGMLEADEAAFFSRSFLDAPRMVQDEIRALQASIASDLQLVSDEEPPAFLRNKVIGAVLEEIDDATKGLAPIATIGALRNTRAANAHTENDPESLNRFNDVEQHLQVERRAIRVRSMNRTLMAWRAATVGLAAALLATFMWVSVIATKAMDVNRIVVSQLAADEIIAKVGPHFGPFLAASCQTLSLVSTRNENVAAVLYVNTKTNESFLLGFALQTNKDYTVRCNYKNGSSVQIGKLIGGSKITGGLLAQMDMNQMKSIEVLDDQGQIVLRTV